MQIKKDTIIGDILDAAPDTAPFFLEMGMHCLGCPASRGETVEILKRVDEGDLQRVIGPVVITSQLSSSKAFIPGLMC